jgi:hypothetical protein
MTPERQVDDRIADWVDGRLVGRERERFVAELRVNQQLRRELEDYERTVALVRSALQAPTQPTQLADRVLAAIARGRQPQQGGGGGWRWRPLLWSAATAAALLVVALVVDAWSGAAVADKVQWGALPATEPETAQQVAVAETAPPPSAATAAPGASAPLGAGAAPAPADEAAKSAPRDRGADAAAEVAERVLGGESNRRGHAVRDAAAVPLPLVVLQGRAPTAAEVFAVRTGQKREADLPTADGRRFEDFLTAQVAQAGRADAKSKSPPPAAATDWLQVANLRLRRLAPDGDGGRERAAAADAGEDWVEHDWLVEGTRPQIAELLQRVASFAHAVGLQVRTSETTSVPAGMAPPPVPTTGAAAADAPLEPTRIVLRFRLQGR